MIKKIFLSLIAATLMLAGVVFFTFLYHKSPPLFEPSVAGLYHDQVRSVVPASSRKLEQGRVLGFADNYDTFAWIGLPYAQAPIGDLRWKAPRPHAGWASELHATEYGAPCMQFWGELAGAEGLRGDVVGSEDCLSLNIWAPRSALSNSSNKSAVKPRPTMVWIHSGGNDSGASKIYQGHHLAGSQDVVVVTINYRLGLLGWFSHDAIRANAGNLEDASGNFGTLDIIQALKWVQANITEFGGDPDNVTVFGESAGGRNVYSLLASPLAKGLFHRAIAQSGTVDTTLKTLAEDLPDEPNINAVSGLKNSSNALIELVLKQKNPGLNIEQIREKKRALDSNELLKLLRLTPAQDMMRLAAENLGDANAGYMRVARVIRDGYVIPKDSLLTLFSDADNYNKVPIMMGTNRDEQKVFMVRNPEYVDIIMGFLPRIKEPQRYALVADYVSRNWKAGAVDEPAKRLSLHDGQSVFAYRFDWDDMIANRFIDMPAALGASHGMEINYVFGDFRGAVPYHVTHSRANFQGRKRLSEEMMSYWAQFAATGAPGRGRQGDLPLWSPWQAEGKNLMLFDAANDGGTRMAEVRTNVVDLKKQLLNDEFLTTLKEKCDAYASLFLHGYQTSDFYDPTEYLSWGCGPYPVGQFR